MEIEIHAESSMNRGEELPLGNSYLPKISKGRRIHLGDLSNKSSPTADACIYCGSRTDLSNEHVIPFAWGGTLQILNGSCEDCRKITSRFEQFALNDGAMTNVRKARGLQSRSKHKSADDLIEVNFSNGDLTFVKSFNPRDVPLILGFPLFALPGLISGSDQKRMQLEGWITASIGPDVEAFLKANDATGMRAKEIRKSPVAFARSMAKIAYCYAWVDGVLDLIGNSSALANAFLKEPDELGAFVGTKPDPIERFENLEFRLQYRPDAIGFLYMEVQPFPNIPAPTYVVVIGACDNFRTWRNVRKRISKNMLSVEDT